ncbi:MAG TPA: phosphotransferase [Amycolatopsis sp.]|uniref:phosphotransferase family protein n=1 Tax=Amycolatopsis sp. TaxID=37632 RepID=UPI002B4A0680|nr:phosphotransferase [Amycolatopsis sp.]HKS47547.1 phosphotransferase [Amycolatopsis sp.]
MRLGERIEATTTISTDDRTWLLERLAELRERYTALPPGLPRGVVHGDAWRGNIARTGDGRTILLDLESCALGPPEWDLTSTAVSRVTTGWLDAGEWADYSAAYDLDVTTWTGFDVLRDIRELRMTSMACQVAATDPERYGQQAAHRLACLRGRRGSRPWPGWEAVP